MSHELTEAGQIASGQDHDDLISADRVAGTNIYDLAGERLGEVQSIMIDKIGGDVAYVIIAFGGILGIGEKYHPLPWDMLRYDTEVDCYRVDLDLADLEGAPSYDRDELAGFDSSRSGDVDRFYGGDRHDDGAAPGVNRSDLNDGIDRPLGFYSRKAQSLRNGHREDVKDVEPSTGLRADEEAPGFFSPEQQQARENSDDDRLHESVRQHDPALREIDGRRDIDRV